MGWLCTHKPKGQSVSDFFLNDSGAFKWSDDSPNTYKVLDSAFVNFSEFYAAVECINKETGVRRVWAAIILVSFEKETYNNFCYKDMDETCGPCADNCPKRILDLLTPTESEYALGWRAACRKKIKDKDDCKKIIAALKIGGTLNFDKPLVFIDGHSSDKLKLTYKNGRTLVFDGRYMVNRACLNKHLIDGTARLAV